MGDALGTAEYTTSWCPIYEVGTDPMQMGINPHSCEMLVVPLCSLVFQLSYKGVHSLEILLPMEGLPPPANAGDTGATGWIPGSGRYLEKEMATHSSVLAGKTP